MKALLSAEKGGPDSLVVCEIGDPTAKAGEVVVRVAACGVNFPDALIIEDRYQYRPVRPFSPGAEIAGIVETTGPGVTWPRVGDRVMGMIGWGGMAEKVVLPASACIGVPDPMPFDEAAGFVIV